MAIDYTEDELSDFISGHERELIGCLLMKPDQMDDVNVIVHESHFRCPKSRAAWLCLERLHASAVRIDTTTLLALLRKEWTFRREGAAEFLANCIQCVPNAAGAMRSAKYVSGIDRRGYLTDG